MENANLMLAWSEDLKKEINELPFDKDDIRQSFFGLLYDIGYCYYRGFMLFDITDFINEGKIMFDESTSDYSIHINRAIEISQEEQLRKAYYNSLNRNLLVSTWSNFELCATTFCETITSQEEKENLLAFQFNDINKKLRNSALTPADVESLKTETIKEHLTHVPIVRKTDLLFKKASKYTRDKSKDKEFLTFMGKFRNTIHRNFIYLGKDYEYKYNASAHFIFKNNETVKWSDKYNGKPQLYFDMMTTLKEIWKELIMSIDYKDIIPYPVED